MAEDRKSVVTILLRKSGKKTAKVELFPSKQWGDIKKRFRIRVNGKWFNGSRSEMAFYYKAQIRELVFSSLKL